MVKLLTDAQIKSIYPNATADDITSIQSSVYARICEYCNTTFEPITYEEEKQDSYSAIIPEHRPVLSVTSLEAYISDELTSLVQGVDFYTYPKSLFLISPTGIRQSVVLAYTAGYSSVPDQVKMTALTLLRFRAFREQEGIKGFVKKQTLEELSYEFDPAVTESSILAELKGYVETKSQSTSSGQRNSGLRIGYMNG